ncbi:MAG: hypothetical protein PHV63_02360 [Candidatus Daviesbacteria bacterium]|nr:hypothetical protein [Candidatus Daviesbacteria bacterium]
MVSALERGVLIGQAVVEVPGRCGNLVYGIMGDLKKGGYYVSIPCPVDSFCGVSVSLFENNHDSSNNNGNGATIVGPEDCLETVEAVTRTLGYLGRVGLSAKISVTSANSRSKGMRNSASNIAAAIGATVRASGENISPSEIASLAGSIEPSNVMLPGLALVEHREVLSFQELGSPPPIKVVALDFGYDLEPSNNQDQLPSDDSILSAIYDLRRAIATGKPWLFGRGATLVAEAYQCNCSSKKTRALMKRVTSFAESVNAVGVMMPDRSVIGVLLSGDPPPAMREILTSARCAFPEVGIGCFNLVGGGLIYPEDPEAA